MDLTYSIFYDNGSTIWGSHTISLQDTKNNLTKNQLWKVFWFYYFANFYNQPNKTC